MTRLSNVARCVCDVCAADMGSQDVWHSDKMEVQQ